MPESQEVSLDTSYHAKSQWRLERLLSNDVMVHTYHAISNSLVELLEGRKERASKNLAVQRCYSFGEKKKKTGLLRLSANLAVIIPLPKGGEYIQLVELSSIPNQIRSQLCLFSRQS